MKYTWACIFEIKKSTLMRANCLTMHINATKQFRTLSEGCYIQVKQMQDRGQQKIITLKRIWTGHQQEHRPWNLQWPKELRNYNQEL